MILDINKQRLEDDLIELYQVEIGSGFVYFTTYDSNLVFRDFDSPYTERTYVSLPINFSGFEHKADGAYARPTITFANVLQTFENSIGSNEDLIGKKVTRRRTLLSYTGTGGSGEPTELPKQTFIIDRIQGSNPQSVSFELVTPFDVAGVKVPGRYVIPNACSWRYQGASADYGVGVGGCTWNDDNRGFTFYLDINNNLLIDSSLVESTAHTGGSYTVNLVYKVGKTGTRVEVNGTTSSQTIYDLWQPRSTDTGTLGVSVARRCRQYSTYNASTTYYVYKEGRIYNDIVLYNNRLWVCISSHAGGKTPAIGSSYWQRVDNCGKKLSSCIARYQGLEAATGVLSTSTSTKEVLPYGGFPASRRFS